MDFFLSGIRGYPSLSALCLLARAWKWLSNEESALTGSRRGRSSSSLVLSLTPWKYLIDTPASTVKRILRGQPRLEGVNLSSQIRTFGSTPRPIWKQGRKSSADALQKQITGLKCWYILLWLCVLSLTKQNGFLLLYNSHPFKQFPALFSALYQWRKISERIYYFGREELRREA